MSGVNHRTVSEEFNAVPNGAEPISKIDAYGYMNGRFHPMDIEDVQIDIIDSGGKVKAKATIMLAQGLVIRQVRIVQLSDGRTIVQMPDEIRHYRCPTCSGKNRYLAKFCNWCGDELTMFYASKRVYQDLVFPCNAHARKAIHEAVIGAYETKLMETFENA